MKRVYKGNRALPATIAVSLLVICPMGCNGKQDAEKPEELPVLRISTHGGAYLESQQKAFFRPYEKISRIRILEEAHEENLYEKLRTAVSSRTYSWDIVVVEGSIFHRAVRDGLLEPVDYEDVNKNNLLPWAAHSHGVATIVYSTVLAYSQTAFPAEHPTSWKDFFDVKRFPGPRCLQEGPVGNLEIALLADGVVPEKLYPLDVNRAFRKLDEIKPHVKAWWTEGQIPSQLLARGEVVMASSYNGRIWAARKNGVPLAVVWNQGLMNSGWWVIPRGLPLARKQRAMDFIAFASRAEPQANQARFISYGPTNIYAMTKVPEEMQIDLPTEEKNLSKQIRLDNEWWARNEDVLWNRWREWKGN